MPGLLALSASTTTLKDAYLNRKAKIRHLRHRNVLICGALKPPDQQANFVTFREKRWPRSGNFGSGLSPGWLKIDRQALTLSFRPG